jgi:hypothetical protein
VEFSIKKERISLLKPGIMVGLKSKVSGGVKYDRYDIADRTEASGASIEKWETTKTVRDPEEHARATKARNRARNLITRLCADTAFGLLCPMDRERDLDTAITQARQIAKEHNDDPGTAYTEVSIFALKGKFATTAEEEERAARALYEEIRTLIASMDQGITDADPDAIKNAANKARQMAMLLSAEQQEKIGDAIKAARQAARTIVARVEKKGEVAATVIADIQRGDLEKARFAFADFDECEVIGEATPMVDVQRMAEIDVEEIDGDSTPEPARAIEIDETEIKAASGAE